MSLNLFNNYKKKFNLKMSDIINAYVKDDNIKERIFYCLNNGKRLRPIISIDICLKLGYKIEDVIKIATAIELIHNSSLIIDDFPCMDDDNFRRGKLAFHKKYSIEEGQIIAQYIVNLAFKLINDNFSNYNSNLSLIISNICKNLGILGVAGGQLIDASPLNIGINKKDIMSNQNNKKKIEDLFNKKTCSLFEIAFLSGYLSGNGNHNDIDLVISAAKDFGMAFQIYDDFDDIEQDKKRIEMNLYDPNYINNFGKEEALKKFNESLNQFKKTMNHLNLYSNVMEQLYNFLNYEVKKKLNNI